MAQDIREAFIGLFGEDKAPKVPTTKEELLALRHGLLPYSIGPTSFALPGTPQLAG